MKILLIEGDSAFAQELSAALEARGIDARVTGDGKEGLELARVERPDLIVLCVELPKMSGYSVCNKLKKDDELKSIPLVVISAEATPETFEQHRKLKTRAEGYLIKPFAPGALLELVGGLVELPPEPARAAISSEEIVTLEDVELESFEAEAAQAMAPRSEDDDLQLLDQAFDNLAAESAATLGPPLGEDLDRVGIDSGSPPSNDALQAASAAAEPGFDKLDEADLALAALGPLGADETTQTDLASAAALLDGHVGFQEPAAEAARTGTGELTADPRDAENQRLRDRVAELLGEVASATEALGRRSSEVADVTARLTALEGELAQHRAGARRVEREQSRATEDELRAAREEARRAEERAAAAETEAKNQLDRASRDQEARRQVEGAAAAAEERARQAEERTHAAEARTHEAEERARAAEARTHAAEERARAAEARTHAAEEQARSAEARAAAAETRTVAAEARATTAEQESASLGLRLAEEEQNSSQRASLVEEVHRQMQDLSAELEATREKALAHEGSLASLRPELDKALGDLAAARASTEGVRAESDRSLAELRKRIAQLEGQLAQHEERILKAYQRIRGDDKRREKTRKALGIALQILEDRAVVPSAEEEEPRPEQQG